MADCRGAAPKGVGEEAERQREIVESERGREIGATPDNKILTGRHETPCAGEAQSKERGGKREAPERRRGGKIAVGGEP